jgi:hypothetical protein
MTGTVTNRRFGPLASKFEDDLRRLLRLILTRINATRAAGMIVLVSSSLSFGQLCA